MQYHELEKLLAVAYLEPERFVTDYDDIPANQERKQEQYQTGLSYSQNARWIAISYNSICSAVMKNGGLVTSYESIGYHGCTADLLRGFLDGPAPIKIYREGGEVTIIHNRSVIARYNRFQPGYDDWA